MAQFDRMGTEDEALKIEQDGDPEEESTAKVRGSEVVLDLDGVTEI